MLYNFVEGEGCILVEVLDGAAFDDVMARAVFTTREKAADWAEKTVMAAQAKRRAEGETDETFVVAIYHSTRTLRLDPLD